MMMKCVLFKARIFHLKISSNKVFVYLPVFQMNGLMLDLKIIMHTSMILETKW